jgi:protein-tyrosine phosphatase
MKNAIVFILFSVACGYYAVTLSAPAAQFLLAAFAIAFLGVGLAYSFLGQRAFLKKADGSLSWLSYLTYWPYHLLNALTLGLFRWKSAENAYDQIAPNVYLGCRLNRRDEPDIERLQIKSVLDLTCEFSEIPALRQLNYRCIPVLDQCAPSLESLQDGARWIRQQAENGPVYVHCALGHGRSAMFVAAYLLLAGKASTPQEALEIIKAHRPHIELHPAQLQQLNRLSLV